MTCLTFQTSLPVHFFNTIGHGNHHAYYKQQFSVPYHSNNENASHQQQLVSSQHHPLSFDSVLKAPANFRDSALYSNDPNDHKFPFQVVPHFSADDETLQPAAVIDQRQQQHYFYQPSYTNIPGNAEYSKFQNVFIFQVMDCVIF